MESTWSDTQDASILALAATVASEGCAQLLDAPQMARMRSLAHAIRSADSLARRVAVAEDAQELILDLVDETIAVASRLGFGLALTIDPKTVMDPETWCQAALPFARQRNT